MKRNNKALYEKIMRSVSKEVKKALNEYGDTPEGQKRLAQLHHRNINQKIDDWHKNNTDPDKVIPDDQDKDGWYDISSYAHKQSKGKDRLRRAFTDELDRLMFGERKPNHKNIHYPHDVDIDVDTLYNELESYVKEKQNGKRRKD